jgi:hypothetical protein
VQLRADRRRQPAGHFLRLQSIRRRPVLIRCAVAASASLFPPAQQVLSSKALSNPALRLDSPSRRRRH